MLSESRSGHVTVGEAMRVRAVLARAALQWRVLPRRVKLLVQVGSVSAFSIVVFTLLLNRPDVDSTAASLLVGVALAAVGFLQNRQVERRQRTVELIAALQNSDTLSAADCWMAKRIARADPVTDAVDEADDLLVITLLDYYEFLCVLAERGHLDGELLSDLRGGAMRRTWQACSAYITARRIRVGGELYRRFDDFVQMRCPPAGEEEPAA